MSRTRFIILILSPFLLVIAAFAQQKVSIRTDDIKPLTSEFNILRLEDVGRIAKEEEAEGRKTIVVAYLGTGEHLRKLNQRRLYNVQTFLSKVKGINAGNIVVAEGKKATGYGRVDIYVGGKLVVTLTIPKNEDLLVDCCEGDINYYPSKDLRRNNGKREQ